MRVHKINNVNKALDFIASKGVKLVSIGAEGESRGRRQRRGSPAAVPEPGGSPDGPAEVSGSRYAARFCRDPQKKRVRGRFPPSRGAPGDSRVGRFEDGMKVRPPHHCPLGGSPPVASPPSLASPPAAAVVPRRGLAPAGRV